MGGFGAVCKNYHLCRRRRWVRMRTLVQSETMQEKEVQNSKVWFEIFVDFLFFSCLGEVEGGSG